MDKIHSKSAIKVFTPELLQIITYNYFAAFL